MTDALTSDQIRRVLVVFQFDNCDALFWRVDDEKLSIYATCSDFFAWGGSDVELVESEEDVQLLERCADDIKIATNKPYPCWVGELYASRKREEPPAAFMLSGKYALAPEVASLFHAPARQP